MAFKALTPNARSLILGDWLDLTQWRDEPKPETALPSFVRGWRAARKYYLTYGLTDVEPPQYGYEY
jgi:RNA-directed DNA polymerase